MNEQLYRIDWKKLTEGLDDKELLFIEGCVEEATMKEEERIGIEVDVGDGPVRPKWKRRVTEWGPNGVVLEADYG